MSTDEFITSCKNDDWPTVARYITNGYDINCKDQCETTPLIEACASNHLFIVKLLVNLGKANVNLSDPFSFPLMYACHFSNVEMIEFLVESGAKISKKDLFGDMCIHKANTIDKVKYLVSVGADVEAKGKDGMRPIHYACYEGRVEIFNYLVHEAGVDAKALDDLGRSPGYYLVWCKARPDTDIYNKMAADLC